MSCQCEIIQGRAEGKLLAAAGALADLRLRPEQQPQPDGWRPPDIFGAWLDRSLVAKAARRSVDIPDMRGAVRMARGAGTAQLGQGCGRADSAMGRTSEKLPQPAQR